jgi:hypothetical protein
VAGKAIAGKKEKGQGVQELPPVDVHSLLP